VHNPPKRAYKVTPLKNAAELLKYRQMAEITGECTRCGGQRTTSGYPLWCHACQAKRKREYEATKKEMSETRGFAAGVTAMRHYLAGHFRQYGPAGFTGTEIAATIMTVKGPGTVSQPTSLPAEVSTAARGGPGRA
jgi:hypothetical protein